MKKHLYIISLLAAGLFFSSCDDDNYSAPDATVAGTLIDAITGEPFQSKQPEGYRISLLEEGYTVANLFWGKADGTFFNSRVFAGNYEIKPTQGAFVDPEVQTVRVPAENLVFTVQPFANVAGNITVQGGKFHYEAQIKKGAGSKITGLTILILEGNPNISEDVTSARQMKIDLSGIEDDEITATTYSGEFEGMTAESGKKYYGRLAVLTSSSGKYNYSPPVEIN